MRIYFLCCIIVTGLGCHQNHEQAACTPEFEEPGYKELEGYKIFQAVCAACHAVEVDLVGSAMGKILERRNPEWIVEFIQQKRTVYLPDHQSQNPGESYIMHPGYQFSQSGVDSLKYFFEVIAQMDSQRKTYQKHNLEQEFERVEYYGLHDTLTEDFNADGYTDKAVFTAEMGKWGILIVHGITQEQVKIGLGSPFEEMGEDFFWVQYWGVVKDSSTYDIIIEDGEIAGERTVSLKNPSIVVRKEDVGGGVITFLDGHYQWLHQSD